jgi:hypothetical protein
MKLDCILTAVNENPLYIEFIPIFIKTWNKLYPDIDVKIILVAKTIPEEYMEYKDNIILFEPVENVLTSFTSQFIRLMYPCLLNYENAVMITDMDMLPMNNTYYTEYIKEYDNSKFIYYRDDHCFVYKQLAMCYNAATPKIWSEIFDIHSIDDIRDLLINISRNNVIEEGHGKTGWSIDQIFLYARVMDWQRKTNNLICLKDRDTKFNRLDRETFGMTSRLKMLIEAGIYTDYHCYRPMSKYLDINNAIYNILPTTQPRNL